MLPPEPPKPSSKDFDPAEFGGDDDVDMATYDEDDVEGHVELSSVEINILVYLYLLESNFTHAAFALLSESNLPSTALFQHFNPSYPSVQPNSGKSPSSSGGYGKANGVSKGQSVVPAFGRGDGRIPRGELVRKLWKGLRWEEIERHVSVSGETFRPACPNPFHLLIPHSCPPSFPSASQNPPASSQNLTSSPPSKRSEEAFPPPEEAEAGPSRSTTAAETSDARGKRKERRASHSGSSRNPSPARSASPVPPAKSKKGDKKRARVSGGAVERSPRSSRTRAATADSEEPKDVATLQVPGRSDRGSTRTVSPIMEDGPPVIPDSHIFKSREHKDVPSCLAWNPKNKDALVTGSADGTARIWDFLSTTADDTSALSLASKKPTITKHQSVDSSKRAVTAVAWHPDGSLLATACRDGVGRLWTPGGQLQCVMSYGHGSINALKFNPSGSRILLAKDDFSVCLWTMGAGSALATQTRQFRTHSSEVNDVDWLDDHVFASGGNDHAIFVYRQNDTTPRYAFKGHTDDVTRVAWSPAQEGQSPGERLLASVSDDGLCLIWRLPSYPDDRGTNSRSMSPTKAAQASGATSGTGRESLSQETDFFDGKESVFGVDNCVQRLRVVDEAVENKRMSTLAWSPASGRKGGRMIVAAGGQDSSVKLFDALSGETLHVLPGLEAGTGSLSFSPVLATSAGLGHLAAGAWNGQLLIYDVETGEQVRQLEVEESSGAGPLFMAMSWRQDGEQLAMVLHNKVMMTIYVGDLGKKVIEA